MFSSRFSAQARERGGAALAGLLCCGKPCARALPACGHICGASCHPGACPGAESCEQEVTVCTARPWFYPETLNPGSMHVSASCLHMDFCGMAPASGLGDISLGRGVCLAF